MSLLVRNLFNIKRVGGRINTLELAEVLLDSWVEAVKERLEVGIFCLLRDSRDFCVLRLVLLNLILGGVKHRVFLFLHVRTFADPDVDLLRCVEDEAIICVKMVPH